MYYNLYGKFVLCDSTISHIGFILLALAINTEQSIESFIFYIIQYSITNLNTFLIIIGLGFLINYSKNSATILIKNNYENVDNLSDNHKNGNHVNYSASLHIIENKNLNNVNSNINFENKILKSSSEFFEDVTLIKDLKNQFNLNPIIAISLAICLFSMAGVPPLIGFFSKQMVLYAAIQSGYYFMAVIAIIVSVISASYYLRIVKELFNTDTNINPNYDNNDTQNTKENFIINNNNISDIKDINNLKLNLSSLINIIKFNSNISNQYKLIKISENIIANFHSFLISTLTLSILLFILKPSILLNSIQLLSLSLYNF